MLPWARSSNLNFAFHFKFISELGQRGSFASVRSKAHGGTTLVRLGCGHVLNVLFTHPTESLLLCHIVIQGLYLHGHMILSACIKPFALVLHLSVVSTL